MLQRFIKKILSARVYDCAIETPLDHARLLSKRLGNEVWLKREDLQPVFSFKIRGAYNKLAQLSEAERQRGVITASAGNHAQGVALAAQQLGIRAIIVMPQTTPEIKVNSVRSRGAEVVLIGDAFDEAAAHAAKLVAELQLTYIPPYDDEDVIAGQGTIAVEILRQFKGLPDVIFTCVGGGGLTAGVVAYIKYLHPHIKVIGVEPADSNCLYAALEAGQPVTLAEVGIFADGVAVKRIGDIPWSICKDHIDEVILVSTDEICAAIKDIFEDTRSIAEPAGALAVAGMKRYVTREKAVGQRLVATVSGANMNFERLRYVSERTEIGEAREAILAVQIPEKPGSFKQLINTLGGHNITEFNYRYALDDRTTDDAAKAQIFLGVQVSRGAEETSDLMGALSNGGYTVIDLTSNEMARMHVRHMVGGHSPALLNELVYRFEFPERPGALLKFLMSFGTRWNISMFHYRNHGAAFGRVLVGAQVPAEDKVDFETMLDTIGFRYWEETDNPAYGLFLGK
ncbi:threonine ammonia-lyase, biosynthetic [Allohahella marinimesophila]|uniref:L-threonine dehydratase n=2 Tax=Allohahella marinimesophila TaxID=1054972 RepID=A0ABP7PK94_9GAMM